MNSNNLILIFVIKFFLSTHICLSQCINNLYDLNAAIAAVGPDSTVTLCDGIWQDIILQIEGEGTSSQPILIQSQTLGGVKFTGSSQIKIGGSYINLDGFTFQDDQTTEKSLIEFRSTSEKLCNNCRITNINIDNYTTSSNESFNWVRVFGQNNEIAHSSFLNKVSLGSCIVQDRKEETSPGYHKIHHNYFAHRRPENGIFNDNNGQDAIRIGFSGTSMSNSNSEIYNNYFYDWIGEIEIISNKSGGNKYYNNTFQDYSGALTLRHGNNCEVFNNFFFTDSTFEKAGGIRVIGSHHKIYNNYISGVNTGSSNAVGAINISNGELTPELNEYFAADHAIIAFNTIVGGDKGIRLGTVLHDSLDHPPDSVIIAHNVVVNCAEPVTIDSMSTGPFPFLGNDFQGGMLDPRVAGWGNDIATRDILTSASTNGFRRILSNSPAIDAGFVNLDFVTDDLAGKARPNNADDYDSGAEEYDGDFGYNRPYDFSDVGDLIGAGSGKYIRCNTGELVISNLSTPTGAYGTNGKIIFRGIIKNGRSVSLNFGTETELQTGFQTKLGGHLEIFASGCSN